MEILKRIVLVSIFITAVYILGQGLIFMYSFSDISNVNDDAIADTGVEQSAGNNAGKWTEAFLCPLKQMKEYELNLI